MNRRGIAITGAGAICSLGGDVGAITDALLTGAGGIKPLTHLGLPFPGLVFGEVGATNAELAGGVSGLLGTLPRSRTALLALTAAMEATGRRHDERRTVVISASTVGGMDLTEKRFTGWRDGTDEGVLDAREHPVGHHTGVVVRAIGSKAMYTTISTACSSSANALALGAQLLRSGRVDRVLAGGADALCRFTIEGFRALGAMDSAPARPFSGDRAGMNLGEAAAYLVLERMEDAERAGREPLALLAGWANRNDAFHQTATSPDGRGPFEAMRDALAMAGIHPEDVDHVNAHGTGTENNDLTELVALERLFGDVPDFTSTKALTGHTLAAAGALEAVIAVVCLREGLVPAGHAGIVPMAGHRSRPVARTKRKPLRNVLSSSFGFGGNDTALVLTVADR